MDGILYELNLIRLTLQVWLVVVIVKASVTAFLALWGAYLATSNKGA